MSEPAGRVFTPAHIHTRKTTTRTAEILMPRKLRNINMKNAKEKAHKSASNVRKTAVEQ